MRGSAFRYFRYVSLSVGEIYAGRRILLLLPSHVFGILSWGDRRAFAVVDFEMLANGRMGDVVEGIRSFSRPLRVLARRGFLRHILRGGKSRVRI